MAGWIWIAACQDSRREAHKSHMGIIPTNRARVGGSQGPSLPNSRQPCCTNSAVGDLEQLCPMSMPMHGTPRKTGLPFRTKPSHILAPEARAELRLYKGRGCPAGRYPKEHRSAVPPTRRDLLVTEPISVACCVPVPGDLQTQRATSGMNPSSEMLAAGDDPASMTPAEQVMRRQEAMTDCSTHQQSMKMSAAEEGQCQHLEDDARPGGQSQKGRFAGGSLRVAAKYRAGGCRFGSRSGQWYVLLTASPLCGWDCFSRSRLYAGQNDK